VTEKTIIQGCREGDREAQRELYELTCDRIYSLLLRMTRSEQDAFDLAQDTYVRVFERIHQFTGASGLATWVYRIAVNEGLQFLRRRRRRGSTLLERQELLVPTAGEADADGRLDVGMAVDRLPELERTLITLKYFEGLDYAQMAEVLDRPAGTIASGLNRARNLLRGMLGPQPADEHVQRNGSVTNAGGRGAAT
jgi:RNA polymerase sigma-70 factor, ECF subfamily